MNIVQKLLETYPQLFPKLTREQIQRVASPFQERYVTLSRLRKFQPAHFTAQHEIEWEECAESFALSQNLVELASQHPENIYLLITRCEALEPLTRLTIWIEYLLEAFSLEENLLSLTPMMSDATPVQFAGFLFVLLSKGVNPRQLISSGLLHLYFENNCLNIGNITYAYDLLSTVVERDDPNYQSVRMFLGLASEGSSGTEIYEKGLLRRNFSNYGLTGQVTCLAQPKVEWAIPLFLCTQSMPNLLNLYAVFDKKLFCSVLNIIATPGASDFFKNFLVQQLAKMSIGEIQDLYRFLSNYTLSSRHALTLKLGSLLSDAHAAELLLTEGLEWNLLAAKPTLLRQMAENDIVRFLSMPLTENNYSYVLLCLTYDTFVSVTNPMCHGLFALFLSKPNLLDTLAADSIQILRARPEITHLCIQAMRSLQQQLRRVIQRETAAFSTDGYETIQASHQGQQTKVALLVNLSSRALDYPYGIYQLQSSIFQELFQYDPDFDIVSCLDAMYPVDQYSQYTVLQHNRVKCRSLYESLALNISEGLKQRMIDALKITFKKDREGNNELLLAAEDPSLLKSRLEIIPIHQRLEAIQEQNNAHLFLLYKINSVASLRVVLEALPIQQRFDALRQYFNQYSVLHRIARSPEHLDVALNLLPVRQRLAAMRIKGKQEDEKNVFATILSLQPHDSLKQSMDSLKVVMQCLTEEQRLEIFFDPYNKFFKSCMLQWAPLIALQNLKTMLEALPIAQRFQVVTKECNGVHLLKMVRDAENRLIVVMQLLPEEHHIEATKIVLGFGELNETMPILKKIILFYVEREEVRPINSGDTFFKTPRQEVKMAKERQQDILQIKATISKALLSSELLQAIMLFEEFKAKLSLPISDEADEPTVVGMTLETDV